MSVEQRPKSITSNDCAFTPSEKANANSSPLGLMSRPTRTQLVSGSVFLINRAHDSPIDREISELSCSGTNPRMS